MYVICIIRNYVVHIRALKQALDHGLVFKKVHRVIRLYQIEWLKADIDMNTKLRTKAKNDCEKDFFKLMNNSVFRKTMETVKRHRDIRLVTTDKRKSQLVSEPNYHTTKWFSESFLAIEIKKIKVMYELWYDYIKSKYQQNAKICYMDTDSFIINIKTEDVYEDIADDVEKRFRASNYQCNRPLPKEKHNKVVGLMIN